MVLTIAIFMIMLAAMAGCIVLVGGTALLAVFGDVILFGVFVYWLVKMFSKKGRH